MRFTPTHASCVVAAIAALMNLTTAGFAFDDSPIRYVDDDARPAGEGSSWASAFNDLQAALDAAAVPGSGINEIRVAQGRYVPTHLTDPADSRSATFQLLDGVALKGGYAGIGANDPDANDPQQFESTLSGDINGDDQPGFVNNSENVYHVVFGDGADPTALLHGFVISGGNADFFQSNELNTHRGGGIFILTGSPTIAHCVFRGNSATRGGAMYNRYGSSPSVSHCRFTQNSATHSGSAVYNFGDSSPYIFDCDFISNNADGATILYDGLERTATFYVDLCRFESNVCNGSGGGIQVGSNNPVVITRCTFVNNSAFAGGGGLTLNGAAQVTDCVFRNNFAGYAGGAVSCGGYTGSVAFSNCQFTGNTSGWIGGAVTCANDATFVNCTFSGNGADQGGGIAVANAVVCSFINCSLVANQGGGIAVLEGALVYVKNSIVWGNSNYQVAAINIGPPPPPFPVDQIFLYSTDIQGGWTGPGSNNIDLDPMMTQPGCDNLRLAYNSPCINAGNIALLPPGVIADLDGQPRTQDGAVDMGAYEGGHPPLPLTACEDNLDQGYTVKLIPSGGVFDPPASSAIYIENVSAPDDSWVNVTQIDDPMYEQAGGCNELGCILQAATSIADSQFFMRVYIPFDQANLNGFSPLDVDLTSFDAKSGDWQLATMANTQSSPGHRGQVGDRIVTIGTSWNGVWTFDLGDYGVFWNPSIQQGFVWANVDHASDFAFGVKLPDCVGDCAYPTNNIVNHDDVTAVIDAWGMTPTGPASFADINHDGLVNAADLLAVLNAWGPCP